MDWIFLIDKACYKVAKGRDPSIPARVKSNNETQKAQLSTAKECGDFAASKGKQRQQTCRDVISQRD